MGAIGEYEVKALPSASQKLFKQSIVFGSDEGGTLAVVVGKGDARLIYRFSAAGHALVASSVEELIAA